jgi:y4mF family transcriptional regulator
MGKASKNLTGGLLELGRRYLENTPKPITTSKDLGERIKSARKAKKLNQQEIADLAGVGRRFISELENGKPSLEFDKVINVARATGIDLFSKPR